MCSFRFFITGCSAKGEELSIRTIFAQGMLFKSFLAITELLNLLLRDLFKNFHKDS